MVDTQRFAIWHPPGMPDNTVPKKPTLIPPLNQPPSRFSRNIGQMFKEYHWKDDTQSSSLPTPQSSPTNPTPSSSHFRSSGPPQPSFPPRHLDTQNEEDDEEESTEDDDTSEDEDSIILVPVRRKSPKTVAPAVVASAPVRSLDNRAKLQERSQFQKPNAS